MSPVLAYHATRRACRESIRKRGLLGAIPRAGRPFGVYVFHQDFSHLSYNSRTWWERNRRQDIWEVSYIGPLTFDVYVMNGMILLEPPIHTVTLVTDNK